MLRVGFEKDEEGEEEEDVEVNGREEVERFEEEKKERRFKSEYKTGETAMFHRT